VSAAWDALDRRSIPTNGIELSLVEAGAAAGPPVVLCHGFPELAYSWRHQVPALAEAGFHVVAPDMRGYGRTSSPSAVEGYDMVNLADDLVGLLDALDEERGVFVGHDWGAAVAWSLATLHPERVAAVASLGVPYRPRGKRAPTESLTALFGDTFFYMLYFQAVGPADEELARDPRRFLASFFYSASGDVPAGFSKIVDRHGAGLFDVLDEPPSRFPPWLSEEDLDRYASEFARTGFTGGLNYYRNLDRTWELTEHLAGAHVTRPALFIAGERDPVIRMSPPQVMEGWVDDLRATVVLPGAGHWIQQERPDETNVALLAFLQNVRPAARRAT
jgi:pimeloyl-ACP methyl ester carboxylesterase